MVPSPGRGVRPIRSCRGAEATMDDSPYILPGMGPTQIDEAGCVWVSGFVADWGELERLGISVIVDLEGDIDHGVPRKADNILYVYLPIHDAHLPNLARLHAVAALVAECAARAAGAVPLRRGTEPVSTGGRVGVDRAGPCTGGGGGVDPRPPAGLALQRGIAPSPARQGRGRVTDSATPRGSVACPRCWDQPRDTRHNS